MLKRLSVLGALAGLAVVAFGALAPSASAQEGSHDGTFLAGAGVLTARGDGLVAVKGRMDYTAHADRGILLVKDLAGDADVDVVGVGGTGEFHGFTAYFGTSRAHITGGDVAVILVGDDLGIHVAGKGWAYLKGRGWYEINGRGPFPWNPDGGFAGVAADPAP